MAQPYEFEHDRKQDQCERGFFEKIKRSLPLAVVIFGTGGVNGRFLITLTTEKLEDYRILGGQIDGLLGLIKDLKDAQGPVE